MTLARLRPGQRWQAVEMPEMTGTVVRIGEGSVVVDLDGEPSFETFEARGRTVCIERSGKRRTALTRYLDVRPIGSASPAPT